MSVVLVSWTLPWGKWSAPGPVSSRIHLNGKANRTACGLRIGSRFLNPKEVHHWSGSPSEVDCARCARLNETRSSTGEEA